MDGVSVFFTIHLKIRMEGEKANYPSDGYVFTCLSNKDFTYNKNRRFFKWMDFKLLLLSLNEILLAKYK